MKIADSTAEDLKTFYLFVKCSLLAEM